MLIQSLYGEKLVFLDIVLQPRKFILGKCFFFGMSLKVELFKKKRIKVSINLNWTFLNLRLQLYRKVFHPVSVIKSLKIFFI